MAATSISPVEFAARKFDYIVIGGGTAGLAIAARLSEDPNITVGVLEAGPAALEEDTINAPSPVLKTLGTNYDWQFETVPQPGLGGRTLAWPRGKVLGGTSALNLMTWNRGNKEDYDAWEGLGNKGWGWNDMLPFFKKSERIHVPSEEAQAAYQLHFDPQAVGTDGPIHASYAKEYSKMHRLCYDTLINLGIPENRAHHSGSNVGVWTNLNSVNPDDNTRSYASLAYYVPNSSRKNLLILAEALVQEVIISQENGEWTATGVHFMHRGNPYTVSASREVVISAGSVQSPQLLELSGVGNPHILEDAGIEVKVANPNVGENLQDHLLSISVFEVDPSLEKPKLEPPGTPYCYLPISTATSEGGFEKIASKVRTLERHPEEKTKILQSRFDPSTRLGQFEYIFDLTNWSSDFQPEPDTGKKYASILQILQYPFSRGSIHIRKRSELERSEGRRLTIAEKPIINPGYYSGPGGEIDLDAMTQCIRFADKICQSAPLSEVVRSRVVPPSSIESDAELRGWAVKNTSTDWHPVGTCGMGGSGGIHSGVVDDRLRVYGVKRLRVVDASIMPLQISAHLQATVYAIAEKGAHLIREDNAGRWS
ncbi:GMC oxidoreductase [Annulohypoxylon maeteangense]|uniref:GMC oxidoreductase n=1 Tax=Annulohypoxylon maeteangense TaxID=1927788 RepID=UPI002007387C|nr:GMC oxidoreductase [Annulohypoxylon maeteangense]KAI0886748.1 GMC oxidoreductase [Annulohypoxylon maeteangense]